MDANIGLNNHSVQTKGETWGNNLYECVGRGGVLTGKRNLFQATNQKSVWVNKKEIIILGFLMFDE